MMRILAAVAIALAAADASAATPRSEYQASLRAIEVQDQAARQSCKSVARPARKACLDKAAATRSASRLRAGLHLKSVDSGRAAGREIMASYQESVADAERAGHAAATDRCDALSSGARLPCAASVKVLYRR